MVRENLFGFDTMKRGTAILLTLVRFREKRNGVFHTNFGALYFLCFSVGLFLFTSPCSSNSCIFLVRSHVCISQCKYSLCTRTTFWFYCSGTAL